MEWDCKSSWEHLKAVVKHDGNSVLKTKWVGVLHYNRNSDDDKFNFESRAKIIFFFLLIHYIREQ